MAINIIPFIFIILLFSVPFVGLIVLQVFLSKMEKDWPGLVLPILSLSTSLTYTLIMFVFMVKGGAIIATIVLFCFMCIPPVTFFLIYKSVHKKQKPLKELDKMTIQDLG